MNRIGNKLSYIRHKTAGKRKENGRMIITIPDEILYLFDKYKGLKRLLSFSDKFATEKLFMDSISRGMAELGVSSYVFRHSWATIAQNKCGASTELVGFCLNHASAHKISEGYIEKDFTKVDVLNRKVINYLKFRRRKVLKFKIVHNKIQQVYSLNLNTYQNPNY